MRIFEVILKSSVKVTKPLNPQQARIASLKRNADNAKKAYKAEKDRQTVAKAQQQIQSIVSKK